MCRRLLLCHSGVPLMTWVRVPTQKAIFIFQHSVGCFAFFFQFHFCFQFSFCSDANKKTFWHVRDVFFFDVLFGRVGLPNLLSLVNVIAPRNQSGYFLWIDFHRTNYGVHEPLGFHTLMRLLAGVPMPSHPQTQPPLWLRHASVWFIHVECNFHPQIVISTTVWLWHARMWLRHSRL
jgi:hypothetical protein